MSQSFLFSALIPLALLAVLGVILGGGRLGPTTQDRIERVLFVVYAALILWWLWQVVANVRNGDTIFALLFGVAAVGALHEALKMFRRRRLRARAPG
jgi:hypothetical protein